MTRRTSEKVTNIRFVHNSTTSVLKLVHAVHDLRTKKEPWTLDQTPYDMLYHARKEALEVEQALRDDASDDELNQELGDLLFDVLMLISSCQAARRAANAISIDKACESAVAKLRRRCPHLFQSGASMPSLEEAQRKWQRAKEVERAGSSLSSGTQGATVLQSGTGGEAGHSAEAEHAGADAAVAAEGKRRMSVRAAALKVSADTLVTPRVENTSLDESDLEGLDEWEAEFRRGLTLESDSDSADD